MVSQSEGRKGSGESSGSQLQMLVRTYARSPLKKGESGFNDSLGGMGLGKGAVLTGRKPKQLSDWKCRDWSRQKLAVVEAGVCCHSLGL